MTFHATTACLVSTSLFVLFAACQPVEDPASNDGANEYRQAVPRQETVAMNVPAARGSAASVEATSSELKGQTADLYKLTRGVSVVVNGAGAIVLGLVKAVTHYPPTTLGGNSATWGPWTEALSPNTWKVTVTRVGVHQYEYKFQGKGKTEPDSAYVTVLSGAHTAAVTAQGIPIEGFGKGTFTLDWDASQKLPEHDNNIGTATYIYSRMSVQETTEVKAQFRHVKDDKDPAKRNDVDYLYAQQAGGEGSLEFTITSEPTTHPAPGRMAVKSRWMSTGAGRSDVKASGGDLKEPASGSECWNDAFASTYLQTPWTLVNYGTEATGCVFTSASYTGL